MLSFDLIKNRTLIILSFKSYFIGECLFLPRKMDTIFPIDSQEEFQKAIEEIVSNYYSSNTVTQTPKSSTIIKTAKDEIKKLLLDCDFDTNKVPELLVHKGWEEQKIAFFVKLLNEKKAELLYASIHIYNSEYGETITNFDWLLKHVLGTSEINTLKYPLLQLVLSTEGNGIQKKVLYDLHKDTLLKLIKTLEQLVEI